MKTFPRWLLVNLSMSVLLSASALAMGKPRPPVSGMVDLAPYQGRVGVLTVADPAFSDALGHPCTVGVLPDLVGTGSSRVAITAHNVVSAGEAPRDLVIDAFDTRHPYEVGIRGGVSTYTQSLGDGPAGWCADWGDRTSHDLTYRLTLTASSVGIRTDWSCGFPRHGNWIREALCTF